MVDYTALTLKAQTLIAAAGAPATLERYIDDNTSAPGDPLSVENATDSPLTATISFIKVPTKGGEPGDETGYISPLDMGALGDVLTGDIVVVNPGTSDAERWQVVLPVKLAPAGAAIIFKCQVRLWPATSK